MWDPEEDWHTPADRSLCVINHLVYLRVVPVLDERWTGFHITWEYCITLPLALQWVYYNFSEMISDCQTTWEWTVSRIRPRNQSTIPELFLPLHISNIYLMGQLAAIIGKKLLVTRYQVPDHLQGIYIKDLPNSACACTLDMWPILLKKVK